MLKREDNDMISLSSIGSSIVLLHGDKGSQRQSSHESGEHLIGELTLVPPFLGSSQQLLNADHSKVYYRVGYQDYTYTFLML